MTTQEIIDILDKEFEGKDYIITADKNFVIDITIPPPLNLAETVQQIFNSIIPIGYLFNFTEFDVFVRQGHLSETFTIN